MSAIGEFLRSAGFGGFAAVVAASIAYVSSRRGDAQQQRTAQRDRWWDQAKWALDRLDNPATQDGALAALSALLERAIDDTEKAFVSAAVFPGLEHEPSMPVEPAPGVDREQSGEAHLKQEER